MNDGNAMPTTTNQALAMPQNWTELMRLAEYVSKSDLVPKDFRDKPANCLIAMQMGAEVGLSWANALQSIAVINGRPSIWGDGALALVMSHPKFESIDENESSATKGVCVLKRRGIADPRRVEFSLEDARTAGLLAKDTYKQHQARMLQMRARGRAMRDLFPDALKGLFLREEVEAIDVTPTRVEEQKPPPERIHTRAGVNRVRETLAARKSDAEPAPNIDTIITAYAGCKTMDQIKQIDERSKRLETAELLQRARDARRDAMMNITDPATGEIATGQGAIV